MIPERRVLAIQYWSGDRDDALRLSRYITDLEPVRNPGVDLVFVVRSDAEAPDEIHLKRAARKFNVKTVRAPRAGAGHPRGCWVLWYSLIEWVLAQREAGISSTKWVMTLEADCIPLTRTWISELDQEWDRCGDIRMMGCDPGCGISHVNGNMLVSGQPDFLQWLVRDVGLEAFPHNESWDTWMFPEFLRWGCAHSEKMFSSWRIPGVGASAYEQFRDQGYVFAHGIKDDSLIRQARRHLLGSAIQT